MEHTEVISESPPRTRVNEPGTSRLSRVRESQWTLLALLLTAPFMVVLDFFIVNVAIPSLSVNLHAGPTVIEWIVAGYGLTTAIGLVAAGRLGDRVGRRSVFWAGMLLFTLASGACGVAPGGGTLVAARLVQGLGAALVTPQVLSIVSVAFEGKERARAFGIYGITLGLAAVLGQLIGGLLIQADILGLGWRACFLINLPIGLVALVLVPRLVPESRVEGAGRLDLVGMGIITLGLAAIVLPLIEGRAQGWPAWTWACLAVSPVI
ncbi:MAG: MFS transporter, partial [Gaiellales bacterium]